VDLKQNIPEGIKALWILGPAKTLEPEVLDKLRGWVKNGNTLGVLADRREVKIEQFRTTPLSTGLETLLQEWGVQFPDSLVVDPRCDRIQLRSTQGFFQMINIVDYPYFPLVTDLNRDNPATKGIDAYTMPFVSPLKVDKPVAGLSTIPLAKSSEYSWLDTVPFIVSPMENKTKMTGAENGPFNVALVIQGKFDPAQAKPGRVIVFGTSRFIRSDYPPRPANYTLFLNMVDWSAQDEALLSIRAKGMARLPLKQMTDAYRMLLKYTMIFGPPILAVMAGLFVWRKGKTRRALLPLYYREA
jgi:ABC-type uncharacterized transport system involved in gliding motility auxiliary subunit